MESPGIRPPARCAGRSPPGGARRRARRRRARVHGRAARHASRSARRDHQPRHGRASVPSTRAGFDHQSFHAMREHVGNAADRRDDGGQPRRHGLEQCHRHSFGVRRQHEHIALRRAGDRAPRCRSRTARAPARRSGAASLRMASTIAIAGEHQPRARAHRIGQRGERLDQVVGALAFWHRRPRNRNCTWCARRDSGTSACPAHRVRQHHHLRRRHLAFVDVEVAPLRATARSTRWRAAGCGSTVRRSTAGRPAMKLVEVARRAHAAPAAVRRASPCRPGSSCAACCRARRNGCARCTGRCSPARGAASAPRARTPTRAPNFEPSSMVATWRIDTYGGR